VLDAATTFDLRITHQINPSTEVFAVVENLFDEDVVTLRTATGLYDLGTPRFTRAGIRWGW